MFFLLFRYIEPLFLLLWPRRFFFCFKKSFLGIFSKELFQFQWPFLIYQQQQSRLKVKKLHSFNLFCTNWRHSCNTSTAAGAKKTKWWIFNWNPPLVSISFWHSKTTWLTCEKSILLINNAFFIGRGTKNIKTV